MFAIPTSKRVDISRIPPEILSEIFACCLPVSQIIQKRLSSVCRLWRTVALATPALWASLDITCNTDVLRPPLPIIHIYLQRSGTHPLSIILRAAKDVHSNGPHLLTVLAALTAARQRWRNVFIVLASMTQDILDLIILGDAPLLQSIRCNVINFRPRLPIPLRTLLDCPRLESFQWRCFRSPLLLPLGDTQLTSLSLRTTLSISECVTLLRLSPRLSLASFDGLNSSNHSTAPRLIHPALCILTAKGCFPAFLDALALPGLLDLTLITAAPPATEWDISLSAFLACSKPTLRQLTLSINHTLDHEPTLVHILSLIPHLRSFSLSDGRPNSVLLTATLIRGLHPPPPPGIPLCPCLQRLYLPRISNCPDGLCSAMVRARQGAQAHANGVACLERWHIGFEGGVHDCDQADIEEL
ncbi:hypothetical protein BD779DRAFT_1145061 [Infundibulicybe gibba]|nr:hypothetical protein BD779DRAFT_1145061 [Infundibulicybe gibba]